MLHAAVSVRDVYLQTWALLDAIPFLKVLPMTSSNFRGESQRLRHCFIYFIGLGTCRLAGLRMRP
jgi:hypothetical protein